MSHIKELLIAAPLIFAACNADNKNQSPQTIPNQKPIETRLAKSDFPWIVTIPDDKCPQGPNSVVFGVDASHLYTFNVVINGKNISQDYIITSSGNTVNFQKPDQSFADTALVGQIIGLVYSPEGEVKPIAKIISAKENLVVFEGCETQTTS